MPNVRRRRRRNRIQPCIRSVAVAAALAVAGLAACAAEPDSVSRQRCEALRDHLVELRMASVTADRDQHRAAIRAALGDDVVASCVERTTDEQLRCALSARDAQALVACHQP